MSKLIVNGGKLTKKIKADGSKNAKTVSGEIIISGTERKPEDPVDTVSFVLVVKATSILRKTGFSIG